MGAGKLHNSARQPYIANLRAKENKDVRGSSSAEHGAKNGLAMNESADEDSDGKNSNFSIRRIQKMIEKKSIVQDDSSSEDAPQINKKVDSDYEEDKVVPKVEDNKIGATGNTTLEERVSSLQSETGGLVEFKKAFQYD